MNANDIFRDSRLTHVRELKTELARVKEELVQAKSETESLRSHFALALSAALDAQKIPEGARIAIIDGWNAILGSESILSAGDKRKSACEKRMRLCAIVKDWLARNPLDRAWIVFDGHKPETFLDDRMRINFTGGSGAHRADRMICDYLRARRIVGIKGEVIVFTEDADFKREATLLGATVLPVRDLQLLT